MSKIGDYNLELQEQANDLGFSTVQEALDNGYEVVEEALIKADGRAKAHETWLEEKKNILCRLQEALTELCSVETWGEEAQAVADAIEFIERGEV